MQQQQNQAQEVTSHTMPEGRASTSPTPLQNTHSSLEAMAHSSPRQQHFAQISQLAQPVQRQPVLDASGSQTVQASLEHDTHQSISGYDVPIFTDASQHGAKRFICLSDTSIVKALFVEYDTNIPQYINDINDSKNSLLKGASNETVAEQLQLDHSWSYGKIVDMTFYQVAQNEFVPDPAYAKNSKKKSKAKVFIGWTAKPDKAGLKFISDSSSTRSPRPEGTLYTDSSTDRGQLLDDLSVDRKYLGANYNLSTNTMNNLPASAGALKAQYNDTEFAYVPNSQSPSANNKPIKWKGEVVGRIHNNAPSITKQPSKDNNTYVNSLQALGPNSASSNAAGNQLNIGRDRGGTQDSKMDNWNALGAAVFAQQNKLSHKLGGWPTANLPVSQKWEWLHVRGAQIGGVTDSTNLVAGTHAANSAMIPYENKIKEIAGQYPQRTSAKFSVDRVWGPFAKTITLELSLAKDNTNPNSQDRTDSHTFDVTQDHPDDKLASAMERIGTLFSDARQENLFAKMPEDTTITSATSATSTNMLDFSSMPIFTNINSGTNINNSMAPNTGVAPLSLGTDALATNSTSVMTTNASYSLGGSALSTMNTMNTMGGSGWGGMGLNTFNNMGGGSTLSSMSGPMSISSINHSMLLNMPDTTMKISNIKASTALGSIGTSSLGSINTSKSPTSSDIPMTPSHHGTTKTSIADKIGTNAYNTILNRMAEEAAVKYKNSKDKKALHKIYTITKSSKFGQIQASFKVEVIGGGTFGMVYRATNIKTGKQYNFSEEALG